MVLDTIAQLVADRKPTPNKFTIAMGELIRKSREEANLSQKELAEKIYRRQATLSDMETGKTEVSSGTLALLAAALNKPITYFYPTFVYKELNPDKFTPLEHELISYFRSIWTDHLQKLAVDLVKVLADFDPRDLIVDSIETVVAMDERKEELKSYLDQRRKIK